MIFSPFKFILMALLFVLLVAATGIVTEMLKAPFEVARYRYYLYLRKNGTRTSASSIFESFDFFEMCIRDRQWAARTAHPTISNSKLL